MAPTTRHTQGAKGPAAQAAAATAFVTVGTTKFDELIRAVDTLEVAAALVARGYSKLVLQVGAGTYKPKVLCPPGQQQHRLDSGLEVEHFDFAPGLADRIAAADLVISHAGAGSLFEALGAGKTVVAVPNSLLMDNHQTELAEHLAAGGYCLACAPADLAATLQRLDASELKPYAPGDPAGIAAGIDSVVGFA